MPPSCRITDLFIKIERIMRLARLILLIPHCNSTRPNAVDFSGISYCSIVLIIILNLA